MTRIPTRPGVAALVLINLALLPPVIWPHWGFAYFLFPGLEAVTASLPWRDTLASAIAIGASGAVATLDMVATRWFLSPPRVARGWEGPAYAVLGAFMAVVNLAVMALLVFLWVHND